MINLDETDDEDNDIDILNNGNNNNTIHNGPCHHQ